jgi:hypothetical protein
MAPIQKVKFTYLNRDGGGFAEKFEARKGITVAKFLESKGVHASDFTVRIVRGAQGGFTPAADEVLKDGDRLSCVPLKVEGAA